MLYESANPITFTCTCNASVNSSSTQPFQATQTLPLMAMPRPFSCFIHERLMCLFVVCVCEKMFTIGDSQATSHADDTEQKAQQVAANPCLGRFCTETLLENAD